MRGGAEEAAAKDAEGDAGKDAEEAGAKEAECDARKDAEEAAGKEAECEAGKDAEEAAAFCSKMERMRRVTDTHFFSALFGPTRLLTARCAALHLRHGRPV